MRSPMQSIVLAGLPKAGQQHVKAIMVGRMLVICQCTTHLRIWHVQFDKGTLSDARCNKLLRRRQEIVHHVVPEAAV